MNSLSLKMCCQCQKKIATLFGNCNFKTKFHTSVTNTFHEAYRKGDEKYEPKEPTFKEKLKRMKDGFKLLPREFELLKKEAKAKFMDDPPLVLDGTFQYAWKFDKPEVLGDFTLTCDKDFNEGFSECRLELNRQNKAIFSGILSTQLPKDGKLKRTGYCNMISKRPMKSFNRESYYEWMMHTHLLMRVRGDGRSYFINLSCEGYFDLNWHDMYSYILYTRGGPYWQFVKIPFSKFFLMGKGRVQDKQCPIPLSHVTQFGISIMDKVPGPYHLEIDYVALQRDPSHTEEFAYEMYRVPSYVVGS